MMYDWRIVGLSVFLLSGCASLSDRDSSPSPEKDVSQVKTLDQIDRALEDYRSTPSAPPLQ